MKSKSTPRQKRVVLKTIAILSAPSRGKKKADSGEAFLAIQKKLEEIKHENEMPGAVNNNLSLFRYKV